MDFANRIDAFVTETYKCRLHYTVDRWGIRIFPFLCIGRDVCSSFMASMKKTVDVDSVIKSGDLSPILSWLSVHIWSKGSLLMTDEMVKSSAGETLNADCLFAHLISESGIAWLYRMKIK